MAKGFAVDTVETTNNGNHVEVTIKEANKKAKRQTRKVAEWIDPQSTTKSAVYLSTRKELMLFVDENTYYQFRRRMFTTNIPQAMEFIESHPAFGLEIFKNQYPAHIAEKLELDKREITKDPDQHEPGYMSRTNK